MVKRLSIILVIGVTVLAISFIAGNYFFSHSRPPVISVVHNTPTTTPTSTPVDPVEEDIETYVKPTSTPQVTELPSKVLHDVSFSPQAPFGDWSDQRQQDGCEEASVVMAWKWANGQGLTRQEALEEITNISNWEENQYGGYRDTSAEDTYKRLLQEFYGYKGGRVEYDITLDDVKRELAAGNILIIPFDGQILNNPNFLNGGPERHMLVAIGYDDNKKQIITNDPGTRLGQGFVYSYDNFEASFRNYETGNHEPIVGRRSAMIIVQKVGSP
ncbi:MAG TPA: C39 family peptidase [Candidatus Magasanikbacteria bacterium]|nr:C39 family peptidase [Candidatus Magasanikbacteria bacterium]